MWRAYYQLTKPGVLFGNALSAAAGFLFASQGHPDILKFAWLCLGTTLMIASACVLNNYLDQDIDAKMTRTKKRAAWIKAVGGPSAVIFSIILGVLGLGVLIAFSNIWVVLIEIGGWIDYVVFYGMWSKRKSVHGTLVGSISGAAPILAGYVGAAGMVDLGAVLTFLVLFVWQIPEFYSISIYRREEYAAAGVPVSSVVRGVKKTTMQIFVYTFLFVIFSVLLGVTGYGGLTYTLVMIAIGAYWLWLGSKGFKAPDSSAWARKMFKFSLTALLVFCAIIAIDPWLP
jgi:protoheme IX farnesyltransferase